MGKYRYFSIIMSNDAKVLPSFKYCKSKTVEAPRCFEYLCELFFCEISNSVIPTGI